MIFCKTACGLFARGQERRRLASRYSRVNTQGWSSEPGFLPGSSRLQEGQRGRIQSGRWIMEAPESWSRFRGSGKQETRSKRKERREKPNYSGERNTLRCQPCRKSLASLLEVIGNAVFQIARSQTSLRQVIGHLGRRARQLCRLYKQTLFARVIFPITREHNIKVAGQPSRRPVI
jgi:hypothetical protein